MIADIQEAVEAYFQANWVGPIHYDNTQKRPNSASWISLEVVPIFAEAHIGGNVTVSHIIYVTVYDANKVASARLADKVVGFLKGVKMLGNTVGPWRPVAQGEIFSGMHSRRISFPISDTY